MLGWLLAFMALSGKDQRPQVVFAVGGALVGALIAYLVGAGRITLTSYRYRVLKNRDHSRAIAAMELVKKQAEDVLATKRSPDAHILLGDIDLLQKNFDEAILQYDQAANLGVTRNLVNVNNYAVALASRGRLIEAIQYLELAVATPSCDPEVKLNYVHSLMPTGESVQLAQAAREIVNMATTAENPYVLYTTAGVALARAGNYQEAMRNLQKAIELAGKERASDLTNNLGIGHFESGDFKEAQSAFQLAAGQDIANANAVANMGVSLLTQGKLDEAMAKFARAVVVDPASAHAHGAYGTALYRAGQLNDGIQELREATMLDPNLTDAQYNLGKIYVDQGVPEYAEPYFVRVQKLNPFLWQVYVGAGVAHYKLGQYDMALRRFREAEEYSPNNPLILNNAGVCQAKMRAIESAKTSWLQCLKIDGKFTEALSNLGWAMIEESNVEDALGYLARAIDKIAEVHNNLGLCYMQSSAADLAIKAFNRALALKPELHLVHNHLAYTYLALKMEDRAVEYWEKAVQMEPTNPDIHTNIGIYNYKKGKLDKAIAEFKFVLAMRFDRAEDFSNLGLSYARAKRLKEAIEQFDRAIALEPYDVQLHANRGLACYFANDIEAAMNEWRKISQLNAEYARKRKGFEKSDYDESGMDYATLDYAGRAYLNAPKTADLLLSPVPGYISGVWNVIPHNDELKPVAALLREAERYDRALRALND
jgi:tetratricopeptide (TPR) repeat protein